MSLSSVSIKRPVFAVVMSLILVIFGIVAFTRLEVREYPSIDPPIVTVSTSLPGANSDVIETQVTEPLEQSINGIDGIRTITSTSREGSSQIRVEFTIDRDLEAAANDVRDRVSRVQRSLPPDVEPPTVEKADADATPIIYTSVYSDTKDIFEVNDFATNVLGERMQTIPGVSAVRIFGEKKYAMRMRLDPLKMAAFNVTAVEVQNALQRENVELPSGRIEGNTTELSVRTLGRLGTVPEFSNVVIKESEGGIVRFGDIGTAELGAENERFIVKRNGRPSIGVAVLPQPGSNVIDIADEFMKRLEDIKRDVPEGIVIDIGYDFSKFVRNTITEVEETILIAFLLVVGIIFLFLREWRSTFIPVIAIPVSIIATFFIMWIAGFSINVLTLVGLILAIGLVCDDAIVVLENIYSKIEAGENPVQAAFKGAHEIYFAVISTTLTLAAVFLPIVFLEGQIGRLFREFGVVIAGSVLISAFVALSLSPMLSAYMLKHHDKQNWFYTKTEPFFIRLSAWYKSVLSSFMKIRWVSIIMLVVSFGLIYLIGSQLKSELAPLEDRSNIRIRALAPEGATFEYTERYMDEITQYIIDSIPEVYGPIAVVGSGSATNSGNFNLYLTDPKERERTQAQIYGQLSRELNNFHGIRGFPSQPPTISSGGGGFGGGSGVQFVIQSPSFDSLARILPIFLEEARKDNRIQFVDADLKVNKPELTLTIDRDKAADLGVSVSDIARTLQITLGGQRFGYFIKDGKQYQVIGQVDRQNRNDPYDLKSIFVKNKDGRLIQLDNVVVLTESATPPSRYRFNRFSSATVSGTPAPGYTMGEGIEAMRQVAGKVLTDNFSTSLAGESRDFEESSSSLVYTFLFALVIIFLVLAAQFESFVDPFIIMLTVPMAMAGALISLWLFGHTLNIFSQIGIIMLVGLVTKNAILIVEFANQKKKEGMDKFEAVIEAAVARFRPILMTTLATILGILPIALGAGAGSRVSLGISVVGGLIFSSMLTLLVVPAVYSYLSSKKAKEEIIEETGFDENNLAKVPD
jgi:multidrug efflux pump